MALAKTYAGYCFAVNIYYSCKLKLQITIHHGQISFIPYHVGAIAIFGFDPASAASIPTKSKYKVSISQYKVQSQYSQYKVSKYR